MNFFNRGNNGVNFLMHNYRVVNAHFVGADFVVCIVICGRTNFVMYHLVQSLTFPTLY